MKDLVSKCVFWQLQPVQFLFQWATCLLFSQTSLFLSWISSSLFCFLFFKNVSCLPIHAYCNEQHFNAMMICFTTSFTPWLIWLASSMHDYSSEFTSSCPFIVATFLFLSFPSFPPPLPFLVGLGVSLLRITTMTMHRCRWVFLPGCYTTILLFYRQRGDEKHAYVWLWKLYYSRLVASSGTCCKPYWGQWTTVFMFAF